MPIRGFLACLRARDFETFRRGFAAWPGPALNVVYADAGGHVGYQLVGQLPRRRSGHGTLPLPGWLEGVGWEDELVPFDEMPHVADPEIGFVASANNRPAADGDGPYLGVDWMDGYRMARIVEELAGRHDWDVAGCAALQLDVASGPWRRVRAMALELPVGDADGRMAVAILRGWDGRVSVDSAAASVFALWLAEMAHRIAKAKAPASWRYALGFGFGDIVPLTTFHSGSAAQTVERLCAQPEGWFARGWPAEAADALSSAMRQLRTQHGDDPAGWAWGRLRTLTLRHPAGDRAVVAGAFNLGPVPMPGDGTTPLQAANGPLAPFDNPGYVPNTRAVMDLADPEASRWVLAGGQSGNPMSPHYGDLFALWVRGESVPIAWSEENGRCGDCGDAPARAGLHLPFVGGLGHAQRLVLPVAEQVIGLHEGVDLARALVDDRALGVAQVALDRVLVRVAVGAVDLDGVHRAATAWSVQNHLARPVSRVLRSPRFFIQPAFQTSSRPAWIPASILASICLTSWCRPISSPNVFRSCAYLTDASRQACARPTLTRPPRCSGPGRWRSWRW